MYDMVFFMTKKVMVYSTNYCPFCDKAKDLLQQHKIPYIAIDVTDDEEMRAELIKKSGGQRTVPQIFADDEHIGGFTDLKNRIFNEGADFLK